MSYILEALKKSEQQREIGRVPGISSVHENTTKSGDGHWRWLVVVVLLLNAGLLVLLLWPEAESESESASMPVPATKSAPIERSSATVAPLARRPLPDEPTVSRSPQAADSKPSVGRSLPEPVKIESPSVPPVAEPGQLAVTTPAQSPVQQQRQASEKAPAPLDTRQPATVQPPVRPAAVQPPPRTTVVQPPPRPAAVQPPPQPAARLASPALPVWPQIPSHLFQQLNGSLRLDVHVFSEQPQERFVLINMKKYKQGEKLQEGPQLDEITPEGVILSFRGQQFRLQAQ